MLSLITPVNDVFRRDRTMADSTLLDPTETNALVDGEWLVLDSTGKAVRATVASHDAPEQVFTQKGDFAAQALGKTTVLELHEYEAETDMYKQDDVFAVNSQLTVKSATIDGVTRAALALAASGERVHAICTMPPQLNGSKIRFKKRPPFIKP